MWNNLCVAVSFVLIQLFLTLILDSRFSILIHLHNHLPVSLTFPVINGESQKHDDEDQSYNWIGCNEVGEEGRIIEIGSSIDLSQHTDDIEEEGAFFIVEEMVHRKDEDSQQENAQIGKQVRRILVKNDCRGSQ